MGLDKPQLRKVVLVIGEVVLAKMKHNREIHVHISMDSSWFQQCAFI